MKNKITRILSILCIMALAYGCAFALSSCEIRIDPGEDYPSDAPYKDIPELEGYDFSTSFSDFGKTKFSVKIKWKPDGDYTATYDDNYYIEWAVTEGSTPELIQPTTDKPKVKGYKRYNLKPGVKTEIKFDIDSYYDGLENYGYYRFVKVIKVNENGAEKEYIVRFPLDFTDDDI